MSKKRESEQKYSKKNCELCRCFHIKEDIVFEDLLSFAKWDRFPVSHGHMLITLKRHVTSFFNLSLEEILSLYDSIKKGKNILDKKYAPDGYNIGINIGSKAGQTISHIHVHIIPRYHGDVANPEGGIRNIIPGKGKYTKKLMKLKKRRDQEKRDKGVRS